MCANKSIRLWISIIINSLSVFRAVWWISCQFKVWCTLYHCHGSAVCKIASYWTVVMMTSSNGNIFRVTGHFCGEFTGHRWITRTKAIDANLGVFFDLRLNKPLSKQSWGWWFETPSRSLWRHCNYKSILYCSFIIVMRAKYASKDMGYTKFQYCDLCVSPCLIYSVYIQLAS